MERKSKSKIKKAKIAIILGSGFDGLLKLENKFEVDYKNFGFKSRRVKGHSKKFVFGTMNNIPVVLVSRLHYYEMAKTDELFKLMKTLKSFGVETIIATSAVGGINPNFNAGDLMLIKDHVNFTGINPLMGKNIKFVDMSNCYDEDLREFAKTVAMKNKIKLHEGVHIQFSGPSYETYKEIEICRTLGIDTVSMSMALDNICANYFEIKFLGIAGVVNQTGGLNENPLSHEEVLENGQKMREKIALLISQILAGIKFE